MISAFLQIEGVRTPGSVLLTRSLASGRSSLLFRTSSPIDRGRSVILQTGDGKCLDCVTLECTPEGDYHVLELRCLDDTGVLSTLVPNQG